MNLDLYITDLLKDFENSSDGTLKPYQLMYELLRGEIESITWVPNLSTDSNGQLTRITSSIKVNYYEQAKKD